MSKHREPTTRERATLTRIYGDEKNWNGVATAAPKIRRAKVLGSRRKVGI
jgi:hypothetical protein